ncbi:glucose-1-phosphate adenylyltransferase [Bradymonas sediminis]|uniref:Glucose-1-phosphate adenylyltransferase n=1 Tax=Bradymonas sediminis TaxID=1548548 RepID=A0A2Z4FPY1_9DELT|nr:glucose-1-phosphate adenylyltransferase [Bradymonas sediminis]AWV90970.1 glucose-1-phosphate adenylyltransferase [Bradymonas sediminis]TDP75291.1 glucose-1-phosphate adenylyltransferase [Bradymonas sediminis]
MEDALVMILAGGVGSRLRPLTLDRAKPAVPFGGRYRIIDFVLSNFVNSGFYKIKVLTQYKADSMINHISRGWRLSEMLSHYVDAVPAQQRRGPHWYSGSADAIYQNLNLIDDANPRDICVFGGDHIYKMDVAQMLKHHRDRGAELTVAAIPVPLEEGTQFGIIEVDAEGRIIGFEEKPDNPRPMPNDPTRCLASMGNYIFGSQALVREVTRDAEDENSAHDFGKNIVTRMVQDADCPVFVYDFSTNIIPGQPLAEQGYWRDVGSIDAYWQSSMDLVALSPQFDLYNPKWPIRTRYKHYAPAKFVHDDPDNNRVGSAVNSMVAEGVIVSGGLIRNSILFPRVRVNSYSSIEESVLFTRVQVGRHARLRRCVIDKDVEIPPYAEIGFNLEEDRRRFTVSPEGVVVIPKGTTLEDFE